MENKIVIYKTKGNKTELKVKLEKESIWLTQKQIAELFDCSVDNVSLHLKNIYLSKELSEKATVEESSIVQIEGDRSVNRVIKFFNLDSIISIGYRVNSKQATQFRIWATDILRTHIVKGFTVNEKRLKESRLKDLEGAIKLLKNASKNKKLSQSEAQGLLNVITEYADSWVLLEKYDKDNLDKKKKGKKILKPTEYDFAKDAIEKLKKDLLRKKEATNIFGQERQGGLESILGNLKQSFGGKAVYSSIEERAAHLLYFNRFVA